MMAVLGYTDARERSKGTLFGCSVMMAVLGYTEDQERSGAWEEATGETGR